MPLDGLALSVVACHLSHYRTLLYILSLILSPQGCSKASEAFETIEAEVSSMTESLFSVDDQHNESDHHQRAFTIQDQTKRLLLE